MQHNHRKKEKRKIQQTNLPSDELFMERNITFEKKKKKEKILASLLFIFFYRNNMLNSLPSLFVFFFFFWGVDEYSFGSFMKGNEEKSLGGIRIMKNFRQMDANQENKKTLYLPTEDWGPFFEFLFLQVSILSFLRLQFLLFRNDLS